MATFVVVGYQLVDLDLQVGKGRTHGAEEGLEALGPGALVGSGVVVDHVRRHDLVEDVEVAVGDGLTHLLLGFDVRVLGMCRSLPGPALRSVLGVRQAKLGR